MSDAPMGAIEGAGIAPEESLREGGEFSSEALDLKVDVVGKKRIGVQENSESGQAVAEDPLEEQIVFLAEEDSAFVVSPSHEMVAEIGVIVPRSSGHARAYDRDP